MGLFLGLHKNSCNLPTGILFDTQSQGVPNNLSFLFPDFEYGVNYTVNLDNVTVNGQVKNYQYSFKVD